MVQGNTEVSVNLSVFCHMGLESECIANNFDYEEDNVDEKSAKEHFMFFKTLWMTNRANMEFLEATIFKKKKWSYYSKNVLFFGRGSV